ncbi:MAG: hypothetical protein AAGK79_13375 [Pseudomonadota bacterium]
MSFETELLDLIGDASDSFDIRVAVRRCYFYDFDGYPLRLWDGVGVLHTSDGNEWIGTIVDGQNYHQAPPLRDPRDGTSPRYEFGLPHVDGETFDALKADQGLVSDRELTVYHVLVQNGEGMRPGTALRFSHKLIMQGARFNQGLSEAGGTIEREYSAFVLCRSLEYGRSKFPGGTYTDTSQSERAALLGVTSDSGCSFVAGNSVRTYTFD